LIGLISIQDSSPPPLPGTQPICKATRIPSLDILRGLAVLGILLMNMQSFGLVQAAYENPFYAGPLDTPDYVAWLLTHYLVEGRAISVFAMLFGAGIVLSTRRQDEAGLPSAGKFYKRYVILAVIGLLHAYLLWFGDILFAYAMTGFIIYLMRRFPIRVQLILGIIGVLSAALLLSSLFQLLGHIPESAKYLEEAWSPDVAATQAEIETMRGPWWAWFRHNAETAAFLHFFALPFGLTQLCGGLMLIGMALLRSGFFEGQWRPRNYQIGAVAGIITGFIFTQSADSIAGSDYGAFDYFFGECSGPLMAFGFMCLVITGGRDGQLPKLLSSFAPVGRMALTLYLSQSLFGFFVFTGVGLSLFERFGRVELVVLALAVFATQMVFAHWWLRRFPMGPTEWLWRRLSYGKLTH
jgi:uncharacterized protein